MTTRLNLSRIPEADRTLIARSIRRAALSFPGDFLPDLATKDKPTPEWTPEQWVSFFLRAGWPQADAQTLANGETPAVPAPPKKAHGITSALRSLFQKKWTGTLDALQSRFPQWSRYQLQHALTGLNHSGAIAKGVNSVWRGIN